MERRSSPRPRGWSPTAGLPVVRVGVVPAPAGVVPWWRRRRPRRPRRPRARGGGPTSGSTAPPCIWSSPRPRGWSRAGVPRGAAGRVVPAPAGVVPGCRARRRPRPGRPRARGGGPHQVPAVGAAGGVVPAPAGVVPAVPSPSEMFSESSPRPRGWSLGVDFGGGGDTVVPAPAGGGPRRQRTWWSLRASSPRPRGWSPVPPAAAPAQAVVPAPAGVVPPRRRPGRSSHRRPRARGGGPVFAGPPDLQALSSPRPRGWSSGGGVRPRGRRVVPAPAGVVPAARCRAARTLRRPRARGGGPMQVFTSSGIWMSSPRPRGWSRPAPRPPAAARVVPAPAGVVPRRGRRRSGRRGRPRARGGGPGCLRAGGHNGQSSPRPRGWSH